MSDVLTIDNSKYNSQILTEEDKKKAKRAFEEIKENQQKIKNIKNLLEFLTKNKKKLTEIFQEENRKIEEEKRKNEEENKNDLINNISNNKASNSNNQEIAIQQIEANNQTPIIQQIKANKENANANIEPLNGAILEDVVLDQKDKLKNLKIGKQDDMLSPDQDGRDKSKNQYEDKDGDCLPWGAILMMIIMSLSLGGGGFAFILLPLQLGSLLLIPFNSKGKTRVLVGRINSRTGDKAVGTQNTNDKTLGTGQNKDNLLNADEWKEVQKKLSDKGIVVNNQSDIAGQLVVDDPNLARIIEELQENYNKYLKKEITLKELMENTKKFDKELNELMKNNTELKELFLESKQPLSEQINKVTGKGELNSENIESFLQKQSEQLDQENNQIPIVETGDNQTPIVETGDNQKHGVETGSEYEKISNSEFTDSQTDEVKNKYDQTSDIENEDSQKVNDVNNSNGTESLKGQSGLDPNNAQRLLDNYKNNAQNEEDKIPNVKIGDSQQKCNPNNEGSQKTNEAKNGNGTESLKHIQTNNNQKTGGSKAAIMASVLQNNKIKNSSVPEKQ